MPSTVLNAMRQKSIRKRREGTCHTELTPTPTSTSLQSVWNVGITLLWSDRFVLLRFGVKKPIKQWWGWASFLKYGVVANVKHPEKMAPPTRRESGRWAFDHQEQKLPVGVFSWVWSQTSGGCPRYLGLNGNLRVMEIGEQRPISKDRRALSC